MFSITARGSRKKKIKHSWFLLGGTRGRSWFGGGLISGINSASDMLNFNAYGTFRWRFPGGGWHYWPRIPLRYLDWSYIFGDHSYINVTKVMEADETIREAAARK